MKLLCLLLAVATCRSQELNSVLESGPSHDLPIRTVDEALTLGKSWLWGQRDSDGGWTIDTHRAITTLQLTGQKLETSDSLDVKLTIKQLELQLALALAKTHQEPFSSGQLALYVNALLSLCQNPRDFHGLNLVHRLKQPRDSPTGYSLALVALALCNSNINLSNKLIRQVIDVANSNSSLQIPDTRAMAVLALSCVGEHESNGSRSHEAVRNAIKDFKLSQRPDGSFGNIYSSGIVYQAMTAARANDANWNRTAALEYMISQQSKEGSFGPQIASYFALPALAGVSLASIREINCSHANRRDNQIANTGDNRPSEDTQLTMEGVVIVDISVYVGESLVDFRNLRINNGTTLYTVLNSNFHCEWKMTSFGRMLVSVNGHSQNPQANKYWTFYTVEKNADGLPFEQPLTVGAEEFRFSKDSDVVLRLKVFTV